MSPIIYIVVCLAVVGVCVRPLGAYMAGVYSGQELWLEKPLGWFERLIYRVCGIDPAVEMGWRAYALSLLTLSAASFFALFSIFIWQESLPLNPQHFVGLSADLAFNAAISFITNTNWQSYSGEASLSYFSQAVGIVVQHFISAGVGMAVAVALFRGLTRKQTSTIGNFWRDLVRGVLYILLPLAFVFAVFLVSQGATENFNPYTVYQSVEGKADLLIAQGPVASQVAIKMLGSNGGGFFNANGAHPFENPTPLSNFFEIVSILLLPVALVYTFGTMVGDRRQSWSLLAAMMIVFLPLVALSVMNERMPNPKLDAAVFTQDAGNMEGKEVRFGTTSSALWAAATAATSNGSSNSMFDSFLPLGGLVPLLLIQFGEIIFGGVGSGMYGMMVFVFLTVFVAGLMVGRTPEYLGKKLGVFEIKMASLVILLPAMLVLMGTAIAVSTDEGRAGISNPGAHGFTEVLYAFSSAANNNGSAFAGLNANTPFYNIILGVIMFFGRYFIMVPILAIAGSLAKKNVVPPSAGTLPTHTILFTFMLVGVVIIIGVLTYVPALALGPIVDHMNVFTR